MRRPAAEHRLVPDKSGQNLSFAGRIKVQPQPPEAECHCQIWCRWCSRVQWPREHHCVQDGSRRKRLPRSTRPPARQSDTHATSGGCSTSLRRGSLHTNPRRKCTKVAPINQGAGCMTGHLHMVGGIAMCGTMIVRDVRVCRGAKPSGAEARQNPSPLQAQRRDIQWRGRHVEGIWTFAQQVCAMSYGPWRGVQDARQG